MPIPLILGIGAVVAGAAGVTSGVKGGMKMKEAHDTIEAANSIHKDNVRRYEKQNEKTCRTMDELGERELRILKSFEDFSDVISRIQNRPVFDEVKIGNVKIPTYTKEELKEIYLGANILVSGIGSAATGTFGGFAAAGATTSAIMALGTASTGTAISGLSGVAATNATLAALGGGSLAAGGGGMALGSAVLGATTLGVGLLVGGIIFNLAGGKLSDKADEAWYQMREAEKKINEICKYLSELDEISKRYLDSLIQVESIYKMNLSKTQRIVYLDGKTDWNDFSESEKINVKNTSMLVGLLLQMCKINLVKKSKSEDSINEINTVEINKMINNSVTMLSEI